MADANHPTGNPDSEELTGMEIPRGELNLAASRTKWSKAVIIKRLLWEFCYPVLFRATPRLFFNGWRCAVLRMFGAKVGKNVLLSNRARVLFPWELEIGDGAWIGWDVDIYNYAPVKIGRQAVVSQYSYLCTGTHDYTKASFPLIFFPITVEDQAWVAAGCFVAPGVTVGEGAIVASRSVVTKDVPQWMICAGNPCRPIKPRPPIAD